MVDAKFVAVRAAFVGAGQPTVGADRLNTAAARVVVAPEPRLTYADDGDAEVERAFTVAEE